MKTPWIVVLGLTVFLASVSSVFATSEPYVIDFIKDTKNTSVVLNLNDRPDPLSEGIGDGVAVVFRAKKKDYSIEIEEDAKGVAGQGCNVFMVAQGSSQLYDDHPMVWLRPKLGNKDDSLCKVTISRSEEATLRVTVIRK